MNDNYEPKPDAICPHALPEKKKFKRRIIKP